VGFGILVLEGSSLDLDGPGLLAQRAQPATVGTGVGVGQVPGLFLGGLLKGTGDKSLGGRQSDLFHLIEIDLETGALVSERTSDDNFPPLPGQIGDGLEVFGSEFLLAHDLQPLEVTAKGLADCATSKIVNSICLAKWAMHPLFLQ
jgi:hypothetical protein